MAAFLAKKVPKIFPSKKKTNETTPTALSSTRRKTEKVTASLFRRLSGNTNRKAAACTPNASATKDLTLAHAAATRTPTSAMDIDRAMEPTKEHALASCDCANQQQHQQQQQHETKHYAVHCNKPLTSSKGDCCCNSSSHSDASTLESSPTSTPRETMDPALLSFPDLPKLAFPSSPGKEEGDGRVLATAPNTSIPPSLRLVPRRATAPSTPNQAELHHHDHQQQQQQQQDGEISYDCDDEDEHDETDGFLPPPLTHVSIPMELEFVLPPPSPVAKTKGYLWGPPPRTGEWDDATIESQPLDDHHPQEEEHENNDTRREATATATSQDADSALALQQQREKAAAQASALMKPWIERAARLALLQNRACGNPTHNNHNHTILNSDDKSPEEDARRKVGPASEGTTNEAAAAEPKPMQPLDAQDERVTPLLLRRTRQQQREAALQQCGLRPRLESNLLYHNRALLASLEQQRRRRREATANANVNANANLRPTTCSASSSSSSSSFTQEKQREPRLAPRIVKWHVVRHPSQG